jgi:hypothetical protein
MLEVDDEGNRAPQAKYVTGQEYNTVPPERRRLGALASIGPETLAIVAERERDPRGEGVTALDDEQAR